MSIFDKKDYKIKRNYHQGKSVKKRESKGATYHPNVIVGRAGKKYATVKITHNPDKLSKYEKLDVNPNKSDKSDSFFEKIVRLVRSSALKSAKNLELSESDRVKISKFVKEYIENNPELRDELTKDDKKHKK